jgi:hypothetical protein
VEEAEAVRLAVVRPCEDRCRCLKPESFVGAAVGAMKTKSSMEPLVMKLLCSYSASRCPELSRVAVPSSPPS